MLRATVWAAIAFLAVPPLAAQDTQYWTNQYGNRARMLGGSVIGSVQDISAVYYNPGRLAINAESGLILAGNVFQYTSLVREDALGPGRDLSSDTFDALPALFAGEFTLGFTGKSRWAYSFLTRQNFDVRVSVRGSLEELLQGTDIDAGAEVRLDQNLGEHWGGLSWAWPLGDRYGIGITWFGAVRSQRTREQTLALGINEVDRTALRLQGLEFDYTDFRFLWKVGFGADLGDWQWGVSLTTPSVHVAGSGTITVDDITLDQDPDGDGDYTADLILNQQEGVSSLYRSPLSIGAGGSYDLGSTSVHASVEWFDGVGEWVVLQGEPVEPIGGGESVTPTVTEDLDAVINWGVGLQHDFTDRLGGYLGFRTDHSAAPEASLSNSALSFWDLYHVSGGATFSVGQSSFTMGLVYAFGSDTTEPLRLTPQPVTAAALEGDPVNFNRITVIIGFELSFGRGDSTE